MQIVLRMADIQGAGQLLDITQAHIDNRQLLRDAMAHAGFVGINSEWWHYDFGDRELVRKTYRRIL